MNGLSWSFPGSARRLLLAFAAVAVALCFWAVTASAQGVIPTSNGPVRGDETGPVAKYLGIPYAAPPVGDLRWRPPQPAARWHTPRDATHFAKHCPQGHGDTTATPSTSEDCLYLNVWAPNDRPGRGHRKGLPVMLWIHGGSFTSGSGDEYDATRLAHQGVIVVTINYRLGYLGFLAHPALSAEAPYHGSGDYGLMDQQAALRWVQQNIARFGGDPGNVTIFGESAGGQSVFNQLASPLASGLFDRAISESGSYTLTQKSLSVAEGEGENLASSVGCADQTAACLRAVPVQTLLANQPSLPNSFIPDIDGYVLPQNTKQAFGTGDFNRVPVIVGTNHDEFTIFYATAVELVSGVLPPALYPAAAGLLVQAVGLNVSPADLLAEYPLSAYGNSVALAISTMATDGIFSCPGRLALGELSKYVPARGYEFADPNPPLIFGVPPISIPYKAYHGSEIPSLFDSPTRGHAPFTADQEKLSATMVRYWTRFAATADPNGGGSPFWPAYTSANDTYQSLVPPDPHATTGFAADHKCAFWDPHL